MKTVTVNASTEYDVMIGSGLLTAVGDVARGVCGGTKAFIVSDTNVFPLYGETVKNSLLRAGFEVFTFVFKAGEQSKNLSVYGEILEAMCGAGITRGDIAVALGGGVTGDIAGFAAATYRRGIKYIQIPTTLLAAVDSSVGGKTAIDLPNGKNQAGCFHQPSAVICDVDTLKTLPEDEYRNGCAEVIKYGVLGDKDFYNRVFETPVCGQYEYVIARSVEMKRDVVERDEFESGDRMLLNLGHTFGHAVEKLSGYTVPHGKAVAIGLAVIAKAAIAKGFAKKEMLDSILAILDKYGLPAETSFTAREMAEAAAGDKKNIGGSVTLVLPEKIGKCVLLKVKAGELYDFAVAGGLK